jgi:D-glycero-D-manno-heptose 1,7-bisphosphate phosphatase
MRRAVFLDRDGTIIEDDGYISDVGRIRLFPWSAEAINRLRAAGFLIIVVTNQAGVARGYFAEPFLAEAHRHLDALLAPQGARIDAYYYCPHHPEGVLAAYRRICDCRKPAPGMIEKAAADHDIDVAESFVVGDKWLDIELAQRAGAAGVLVRTGYGQSAEAERPTGIHPVPVVDTLLDAAGWILERSPGELAKS